MVFSKYAVRPFALLAALLAYQADAPARAASKHEGQVSENGVTLRSTTIEMPAGDALYPGGKAAELVNSNCLSCHSTEMVLTQPNLTHAQWQTEVTKMIKVYKAPVKDSDVAPIVDYLSTNPGLR
jgi:cytochrome c5